MVRQKYLHCTLEERLRPRDLATLAPDCRDNRVQNPPAKKNISSVGRRKWAPRARAKRAPFRRTALYERVQTEILSLVQGRNVYVFDMGRSQPLLILPGE